MLGSHNFCWPEVFYGWTPVRETQLGRANDSKQSASWEATQAFKLFWSLVFLVLSLLGLIFLVLSLLGLIFLVLILMYLCCSVPRLLQLRRNSMETFYAGLGKSRAECREFSTL